MSEEQPERTKSGDTRRIDTKPDGVRRPPQTPRTIGQYDVIGVLGEGGMGAVYLAFDDSMKRNVAVKVLHKSFLASGIVHKRFAREAWIAGQLEHEHIIRVYSRGEQADSHYLVMEYADGGSLADELRRLADASSQDKLTAVQDPTRINSLLKRFVELARAIEYVHTRGFIHRDIKPQNILLAGAEKTFKLTDFGIAHAEEMSRVTRAGDFIGTIRYMSPELLSAHRSEIDKRADIYSLGVTLFEALTLTMPFAGDTEEKYIASILAGRSIPARRMNSRIPRDLETVLLVAMHHDPARRYQHASEFADDLERILHDRPIKAQRAGLARRVAMFCRRHAATIGLTVTGAVLVSLIAFGLYAHQRRQLDYKRIGQILQTSITTGTAPDEIDDDWARLAAILAARVKANQRDSLSIWYYRSTFRLDVITDPINDTDKSLKLVSSLSETLPSSVQSTMPHIALSAEIAIGVDTLPFERAAIYEGVHGAIEARGGFITTIASDSLLRERPGARILRIRVIASRYFNAGFFDEAPEQSPLVKDPDLGRQGEIVVTSSGDTLVARSMSIQALFNKARAAESAILDLDHFRPAAVVFVDTVVRTFDVLVYEGN